MSGYNKGRHRRLKGNTVLAAATVLLGCAVIASAVLLFKKTPVAKPALTGISQSVSARSSTAASGVSSQSPSETSSNVSSSETSSAVSLNDALFIGDAFTDGLTLYGGISASNVISNNGMSAYTSVSHEYTIDGKKQVVPDAVTAINSGSIYILLGANDIAQGYSVSKYTKYYGQLIESLQSSCPNAKIYVQSVFPVTAAYDKKEHAVSGSALTNEKIEIYNTALKSLCSEKSVTYLDVASVFKDADGKLPSQASGDGLHLKKAYYVKWLSYLEANR